MNVLKKTPRSMVKIARILQYHGSMTCELNLNKEEVIRIYKQRNKDHHLLAWVTKLLSSTLEKTSVLQEK